MITSGIDIKTETLRLTKDAFEAFCFDMESMLGTEIKCQPAEQNDANVESLKKHFKKLCAVNSVDAQGIINGRFFLILSQEALFTLAGIFVMLPEKRILESRKFGTEKQAHEMGDAVKEAGNMLIGAWDRVFRESIELHKHFKQADVFIGNPWEDAKQSIGLDNDTALATCFYELTAGEFPPFTCCAVFPESIFEEHPEVPEETAEDSDEKQDDKTPENKEEEKTAEPAKEPVEIQDNKEAEAKDGVEKTETTEESAELPIEKETVNEEIRTVQPITENIAGANKLNVFPIMDLKAIDIMNNNVQWCESGCTVEKAIEKMQADRADYLLVGSEQKAQGIVAMSDLYSAISIYLRPMFAKWKRELDEATLRIKVQAIMSKPVRTIPPETTLDVVAEKIVRLGGCLVVVDKDGKAMGIITSKCFLTRLLR